MIAPIAPALRPHRPTAAASADQLWQDEMKRIFPRPCAGAGFVAALVVAGLVLVLAGSLRGGWGSPLVILAILVAAGAEVVRRHVLLKRHQVVLSLLARRSGEARDEALRTHDDFLCELASLSSEIAHELKNPLACVKGTAALMALEPARVAERLAVLRREVDRIQTVLEEYLEFTRPLAPLRRQPIDVRALIATVVDLFQDRARQQGLTIHWRSDDPLALTGDPRKLRQALIHLVQNACEASPAGALVEIEIQRRGQWALVRVLDRGAGLAPDLGGSALGPEASARVRGAGLGLTVARLIIEQHGGTLRLAARPDGGCSAEVALPADASTAAERALAAASSTAAGLPSEQR